ncbi:MAG: helix-turn-helix domain-containing protein [Candidatus Omnitrophica bacterium]|nr:helix-turn-helix domain-containing protein [Candidatus Omnitrophota bacterium]
MTIGERLKSAREAKKISLQEACSITKIQRKTLEALEEDRVEEVLDTTYSRIFLKKYASFLGVDGAALLNEYKANQTSVQEPILEVQTEVTRNRRENSSPAWLVPVGAGLFALIGIATLGYFALDLYHTLAKNSPEKAVKPAVAVQEKRPASAPALLVPASKPLKLSVQTTADVWLQVKSDGSVIFQSVLAKGAQENWTAKKELELWTGNAGAMRLTLNGKPLEGLGRGVRKGVKITHAGIQ